ncbi:unnamed protein product [Pleuronectes platessa]|uniref:Uncharacterized protein n=1 Tax=Pleuronectes platessa TaxID=8262 RepID=A0A9N7Y593_PLEPL|nr:unnamed protein product [Pleuronectes platessa]
MHRCLPACLATSTIQGIDHSKRNLTTLAPPITADGSYLPERAGVRATRRLSEPGAKPEDLKVVGRVGMPPATLRAPKSYDNTDAKGKKEYTGGGACACCRRAEDCLQSLQSCHTCCVLEHQETGVDLN